MVIKKKTTGPNIIKFGNSLKEIVEIYFPYKKGKKSLSISYQREMALYAILLNEKWVGI